MGLTPAFKQGSQACSPPLGPSEAMGSEAPLQDRVTAQVRAESPSAKCLPHHADCRGRLHSWLHGS